MTKEQEKAIETMKHWIDFEKHNRDKINKADDLIKIQETVLNMLKGKDREIEKKDKIIDLMAEFLGEKDMGYYKKEEGGEFLGIMRRYSKEDWKQYFERKVKNGN